MDQKQIQNPNILSALDFFGGAIAKHTEIIDRCTVKDQYPNEKEFKFYIAGVSDIETMGEKDEDGNERNYRVLTIGIKTKEGYRWPTKLSKTIFEPSKYGNKYQVIWDMAAEYFEDPAKEENNYVLPGTTAITVTTPEDFKSWNNKTKSFFRVKGEKADWQTNTKEDLVVLGGVESTLTVVRRFIKQVTKDKAWVKTPPKNEAIESKS
jgi:hypothetical protein